MKLLPVTDADLQAYVDDQLPQERRREIEAYLATRPRLADLDYQLIGGRLLPGDQGPVAQFMYQDASDERLTLYVSTENTTHRGTAFRFAQEGSINVFYWIDGPFGYAIAGSADKAAFARISAAVYDQLQSR